jgi:hypothetical protein
VKLSALRSLEFEAIYVHGFESFACFRFVASGSFGAYGVIDLSSPYMYGEL